MRDPRYSKPFQSWRSALASLALFFLAIFSVGIPLGSLGHYMTPEEFTKISKYSTFSLITLMLSIAFSMRGLYYSRHVISFLFSLFLIGSSAGTLYFHKDIEIKNIIATLVSIIICSTAIKLVNSDMYKSYITYRKKHFQSGKDMVERMNRDRR